MDEIANNAINTDASSQIDILLANSSNRIELNNIKNTVDFHLHILEANTPKPDNGNATLFVKQEI